MGRTVLLLAAAALVAGCTHDSLNLGVEGRTSLPLPQFRPPGGGPTPTPPPDFGDGRDGAFTAASDSLNDCAQVLGVAGTVVETDPAPFDEGDRVLLWQTQYLTTVTSGDLSVVEAAEVGLAGRWQIATVTSIEPAGIGVDVTPLAYVDDGGSSVQACRVPQYTDVTVPGSSYIDSPFWTPLQGGGVAAFFASGTVDVQGGGYISASTDGFRGGEPHVGTNTGNSVTARDTAANDGGEKGEGIDRRGNTGDYGAGNWWQGAGGGNAHGGGGGGGGNGGAGGYGGYEWVPSGVIGDAEPLTRGMPGSAVAVGYPERLFHGGGGGEGQCHHGGCGEGGDGGGLVLIFASVLAGDGEIRSDGQGAGASTDDAGSGGGAGGTIVIVAGSSTFTGSIHANGGDGGDASWFNDGNPNASGPGGGGGGGRVHVELLTGTLAPEVELEAAPGFNGMNTVDPAMGDPWGATPGADGVVTVLDGN